VTILQFGSPVRLCPTACQYLPRLCSSICLFFHNPITVLLDRLSEILEEHGKKEENRLGLILLCWCYRFHSLFFSIFLFLSSPFLSSTAPLIWLSWFTMATRRVRGGEQEEPRSLAGAHVAIKKVKLSTVEDEPATAPANPSAEIEQKAAGGSQAESERLLLSKNCIPIDADSPQVREVMVFSDKVLGEVSLRSQHLLTMFMSEQKYRVYSPNAAYIELRKGVCQFISVMSVIVMYFASGLIIVVCIRLGDQQCVVIWEGGGRGGQEWRDAQGRW